MIALNCFLPGTDRRRRLRSDERQGLPGFSTTLQRHDRWTERHLERFRRRSSKRRRLEVQAGRRAVQRQGDLRLFHERNIFPICRQHREDGRRRWAVGLLFLLLVDSNYLGRDILREPLSCHRNSMSSVNSDLTQRNNIINLIFTANVYLT